MGKIPRRVFVDVPLWFPATFMNFAKVCRLLPTALLLCTASLRAQTLLHYYDFNGASVTDLAGTDNGTLTNGATVSGGKLVLDGTNDSVTFATHLVPTSGAFTVAFFATGPTTATGIHEFISQGSTGSGFFLGYSGANFRLTDSWLTTGIAFPTDGLAHHYALTFNGTTAAFYIDGSSVGTHTGISVGSGGTNTTLGAQFSGIGEYFAGSMDELRIYSSALTTGQVQAIMAIPEPGVTIAACAFAALSAVVARRRRPA